MSEINKTNRLIVNREAILHNYNQIKIKSGDDVKIMPVVKANAYGCGLKEIVSIFKDLDYFAVANVDEARELKRLLPKANILILYEPLIDDLEAIVQNDLIPSIGDSFVAKLLNDKAAKQNKKIKIHIEIDTGISRFGIQPNDCEKFAKEIKGLENIIVDGLFMHYSVADSLDKSDLEFTRRQTINFKIAIHKIEQILGNIKYKHACSGSAVFNPHAELFNMIRPGYILYGYYSDAQFRELVNLKPALKLVSKIIKITEHNENKPIGYSRNFITKRKTKVATIAMGYSHGIYRGLSNGINKNISSFVVNGQRARILGNICMDVIMLDVTDIKGKIKPGDDVYIFDNENVTLEELVNSVGTIGYEFLTRINLNVQRCIK